MQVAFPSMPFIISCTVLHNLCVKFKDEGEVAMDGPSGPDEEDHGNISMIQYNQLKCDRLQELSPTASISSFPTL